MIHHPNDEPTEAALLQDLKGCRRLYRMAMITYERADEFTQRRIWDMLGGQVSGRAIVEAELVEYLMDALKQE